MNLQCWVVHIIIVVFQNLKKQVITKESQFSISMNVHHGVGGFAGHTCATLASSFPAMLLTDSMSLSMERSLRYGHRGMFRRRQCFFKTVTPIPRCFAACDIGKLKTCACKQEVWIRYVRFEQHSMQHTLKLHQNVIRQQCMKILDKHTT